jgi:hypothetical protein
LHIIEKVFHKASFGLLLSGGLFYFFFFLKKAIKLMFAGVDANLILIPLCLCAIPYKSSLPLFITVIKGFCSPFGLDPQCFKVRNISQLINQAFNAFYRALNTFTRAFNAFTRAFYENRNMKTSQDLSFSQISIIFRG